MRIGRRLKAPVAVTPEIERPLRRVEHGFRHVTATSLKQQNVCVRVLGQAPGDHRAGRTAAADDEIIALSQTRPQSRLIVHHPPVELDRILHFAVAHHDTSPSWRAPSIISIKYAKSIIFD